MAVGCGGALRFVKFAWFACLPSGSFALPLSLLYRSSAVPRSLLCRSSVAPLSLLFRSSVNLLLLLCRPSVAPLSLPCRSSATPLASLSFLTPSLPASLPSPPHLSFTTFCLRSSMPDTCKLHVWQHPKQHAIQKCTCTCTCVEAYNNASPTPCDGHIPPF